MPQGFERDEFAVTHNTRMILGVNCVEVHNSVFTDGVLTEDIIDWFAQDREGNVWYFGENTHELEDGLITTIDGTFMAGVNGEILCDHCASGHRSRPSGKGVYAGEIVRAVHCVHAHV